MTGLAQVLALEDALGVTSGHDTTTEFVARMIAALGARRVGRPGPDHDQVAVTPRGRGSGRSV